MNREPVPATPRKAMTPARRARAIAKHDGHCGWIGCTVTAGLEIDHAICLGLGGKEEDANLIPLCGPHHKIKTARDKKLIAEAKRRQRNEDPVARTAHQAKKRQIANRPWPPSQGFRSNPELTRGVDGKVRLRVQKETR